MVWATVKFWALVVAAGLLLGGCLSLPANPTAMTPEQIKEWVKDKSANIACGTVNTPYKITLLSLNLDKGLLINGVVKIDDGCQVTITNAPKETPR